MPLAVVGMSHHTAPVDIREKLAFGAPEASRALLHLREREGVEEAVLLSTCNRTEVYLFPSRDGHAREIVQRLFEAKSGSLDRGVGQYLFEQNGERAVRHLFQVSAGLDSLVIGEAEIQGQVRQAYERATDLVADPPLAGPVLNRLFQMALSVGGQVRAETTIGEGAASVASVAVELAHKIFGSLRGRRVLLLGAGQTGELIAQALAREGVEGVIVANRTYDRAVALASTVEGRAVRFDRLAEGLAVADIVLASTAAPHPILTGPVFREAFPRGASRPLLMIDIAVPRDVDPRIGQEREVFLYNVDDLRRIVDEQVRLRTGAIPHADRIVRERSQEFRAWYASLEAVPVIRRIRRDAELHRSRELARVLRRLDHLSDDDRARLEEFSRRLMNKLLHDPTARLRKGLDASDAPDLVDAARFLYGLEDRDPDRDPGPRGTGEDDAHTTSAIDEPAAREGGSKEDGS